MNGPMNSPMNRWMRRGPRRACIVALACLCACSGERARTGDLKTDMQTVKLGNAKSVSVELQMGAGDLKVKGGAAGLLDGTFSYNVPAWKPKIEYRESGDRGTLTIAQPGDSHSNFGDTKYSWDVRLNNKVPLELHVEMGAGNSDLALSDLSLTKLHVEVGAGRSTVDLAGDWKRDVDAHIEGGVGNATVKLPRNVGVRVTVEGGIGSVSAPDFRKDGDAYVN
jgi:hypothetical protein